jgi:hypothetical protein
MATQIRTDFGDGHGGISQEHGGTARLADALRDTADDITELRTQFLALLALLDTEAQLTEAYVTSLPLEDQNLTKG